MNTGSKKIAYNVGGTVLGALVAALSIFGIVQVQSSAEVPQENQQVINYNSGPAGTTKGAIRIWCGWPPSSCSGEAAVRRRRPRAGRGRERRGCSTGGR